MGNGQVFRRAHQIYSDWSTSELRSYTKVCSMVPEVPDRYAKHQRFDKFRIVDEATRPVWAVAVAEVNMMMAAATADHEVHLWDLEVMELKVTLKGHSGQVWEVKFSTNETTLATGSSDATIRLWDTQSGTPLGVLRGHSAAIRCLTFSYAGYLISGDQDSNLFLWEAENACPIKEWKAHEGNVHSVAFSLAEPLMALSVGADGSVASWFVNRDDDEIVLGGRFAGGDGGAVLSIASHPVYPGIAAVGNQDGSVWIWNFDPNRLTGQAEVTGHNKLRGHTQAVWFLEFSKDACLLASGSADGTVRVWDATNIEAPTLTAVFKAHESWVKQVRWFTEPGKGRGRARLLVTCSTDGYVTVWAPPGRIKKIKKLEEKSTVKRKLLDFDDSAKEESLVPFDPGAAGGVQPSSAADASATDVSVLSASAGPLAGLGDVPPVPDLPPASTALVLKLPPDPDLRSHPPRPGQPPAPSANAPRRGLALGPVNQPLRPQGAMAPSLGATLT